MSGNLTQASDINTGKEEPSLDEIVITAQQEIKAAASVEAVEGLRVSYLGKSGVITEKLKFIGKLPAEERKEFGAKINIAKEKIGSLLATKKEELESLALNEKLKNEFIDVTIPVAPEKSGFIHPISRVIEEITDIFAKMGFSVAEGPEIEDDYHNFAALNFPENHPAKQMHDTFYIKTENPADKIVLRTHTSTVQIRTMENGKPPFKFIAHGRTFRSDSDQTHSPMFHQVEGLYVDRDVNMGMLKGCLQEFVDSFFGIKNLKMRFRASFFPFTEPSAEVDIGCSRSGNQIKIGEGNDWLEVLGCGMVHPNVLRNVGVNPDEYKGFAFGMGIERLAMLKYGIPDLRTFFESDQRWLKHYGFSALRG